MTGEDGAAWTVGPARPLDPEARRDHRCPRCGMNVERRPPLDAATARALARARLERNWSYRDAAEATGVSPSHLWALEHARRAPSLTVAAAIINAYGLKGALADALTAQAVDDAGRDWRPEQ